MVEKAELGKIIPFEVFDKKLQARQDPDEDLPEKITPTVKKGKEMGRRFDLTQVFQIHAEAEKHNKSQRDEVFLGAAKEIARRILGLNEDPDPTGEDEYSLLGVETVAYDFLKTSYHLRKSSKSKPKHPSA